MRMGLFALLGAALFVAGMFLENLINRRKGNGLPFSPGLQEEIDKLNVEAEWMLRLLKEDAAINGLMKENKRLQDLIEETCSLMSNHDNDTRYWLGKADELLRKSKKDAP